MTQKQLWLKRIFDVVLALFLIIPITLIALPLIIISALDTKSNGFFIQQRVGQHGRLFNMFKIRTLNSGKHVMGQLDASASNYGKWLRHYKLDELPQFWHVLTGTMSFVGPRPDVIGFADELEGEDQLILTIKPGITGPATLKYKNEELLLSQQLDPEHYNRTVIWRDKVEINKKYVKNWSFYLDLTYIIKSII